MVSGTATDTEIERERRVLDAGEGIARPDVV